MESLLVDDTESTESELLSQEHSPPSCIHSTSISWTNHGSWRLERRLNVHPVPCIAEKAMRELAYGSCLDLMLTCL